MRMIWNLSLPFLEIVIIYSCVNNWSAHVNNWATPVNYWAAQ